MSEEPKASEGLDSEMLAAYLDKRLPPDARAAVEAQLATDPESYELLVELIHANEALKERLPQDEEQPAPEERPAPQAGVVPIVPRGPKTKGWVITGGVLAVAAALVLAVRLQPDLLPRWRGGDAVDPQLARLVVAVGEERYIEARLTGGFKYGPVTRSTQGSQRQDLSLLAAEAELRESAAGSDGSAGHALALARLLLGNVTAAISDLESASARRPSDARLLADLSAAYVTRGRSEGRDDDFRTGLALADRALAIDGNLLEARFNRALALDYMNDRDRASEAWRDYAARDQSEWGREAAARRDPAAPR